MVPRTDMSYRAGTCLRLKPQAPRVMTLYGSFTRPCLPLHLEMSFSVMFCFVAGSHGEKRFSLPASVHTCAGVCAHVCVCVCICVSVRVCACVHCVRVCRPRVDVRSLLNCFLSLSLRQGLSIEPRAHQYGLV